MWHPRSASGCRNLGYGCLPEKRRHSASPGDLDPRLFHSGIPRPDRTLAETNLSAFGPKVHLRRPRLRGWSEWMKEAVRATGPGATTCKRRPEPGIDRKST